jgi:hypothetical protein
VNQPPRRKARANIKSSDFAPAAKNIRGKSKSTLYRHARKMDLDIASKRATRDDPIYKKCPDGIFANTWDELDLVNKPSARYIKISAGLGFTDTTWGSGRLIWPEAKALAIVLGMDISYTENWGWVIWTPGRSEMYAVPSCIMTKDQWVQYIKTHFERHHENFPKHPPETEVPRHAP